ncbi:MAG: S-adenosylmethionine:tRNA ribosyltransferase-isomerase [Paludibacter sp.]|jgi:S-adenosylmethionine:tRNA ribosyltransferase-isomerase|nr:S-adenosylmethionine:tRNA ribosyltransferase-isomerase [Paludibacter sp.]
MNQNQIYIADYDYHLPDERIAKYPLAERDSSKLLVYRHGEIVSVNFRNLADFLPANSLLVCNNTKVINARLLFEKQSGATIEIFLLEPYLPVDYQLALSASDSCQWKCMIGNQKKWKNEILEKTIVCDGNSTNLRAELLVSEDNQNIVRFSWDNPSLCFAAIIHSAGELPIPPYLHRSTEKSDLTTYQTVYSKINGSVAAPTAGLHFTPQVLQSLSAKNIEIQEITLHVGAGTFKPVKSETISQHLMHAEHFEISKAALETILQNLGHITAVGTTTVRTLESLYYLAANIAKNDEFFVPQWQAYSDKTEIPTELALQNLLNYMNDRGIETLSAATQILIQPGYKFRLVNNMITNFHQPRSTLLLLVSAFVDGQWSKIYDYALANDYRFLSYGDSSLLIN